LAKNVTEVTVFPRLALGEAVTVSGVPTVAVELFAGAVSDTDVEALAVTVTVDEVTVLFSESMTRAVILKLPAADGTHVVVYGAVLSTPTSVVPTRN
jgi:hypothetical protein